MPDEEALVEEEPWSEGLEPLLPVTGRKLGWDGEETKRPLKVSRQPGAGGMTFLQSCGNKPDARGVYSLVSEEQGDGELIEDESEVQSEMRRVQWGGRKEE